MCILFHGIFLGETPSSALNKITSKSLKSFLGEYHYQGVSVLIDRKEEKIYAVGDPGASRAVFYFVLPEIFVLTTDMELFKQLQKVLGIQLKLDIITLYEIVVFNTFISRKTLYRSVNRLLPGEYIVIKTNRNAFEYEVNRYWDVMNEEIPNDADRNTVHLLIRCIVNQLNKYCEELRDRKLIVPISGGLDSVLLLLLMLKTRKCRHVLAWHTNLGKRMELLLSKLIAIKVKVPLYIELYQEKWLRDIYIKLLGDMLKLIGYPREGEASSPYLILAQSMRSRFIDEKIFTVGGEVGDSIFGGHDYYKFFAIQLLLEKRFVEFLRFMKVLKRYNYYGWKFIPIRSILLQLILRFYKLRYQYIKSKIRKISRIKNKKLIELITSYLTKLSSVIYDAPKHRYYHRIVANMLIHKAPHISYARVKAEESQGIITYLPFASRCVAEMVMKIPPECFYFPIGSRSLQRLVLKWLGAPPLLYLQPKSYFSTPNQILKDHTISSHMRKFVENCWVNKYIKIDKLSLHHLHNVFNICIMSSGIRSP